MSQATPAARSGGPVTPISTHRSAFRMPTPIVRSFQMRFSVRRSSYSSTRAAKGSAKSRTFWIQPGVRSSRRPPIRMQWSVSRAPQYSSKRSRITSRSRNV